MRQKNFAILLLFFLFTSYSPIKLVDQLAVKTHPDGPLYIGDQVSFEVLVPAEVGNNNESINVSFNGQALGSTGFAPYGISGRNQATLWWIWNTKDLKAGSYQLTFTRIPENTVWTETYYLHSSKLVPSPEPSAHWVTTTTDCCNLHYISGTAAERDIILLTQEADSESSEVSAQLSSTLNEPIDVVFMSRVVGHGGFTLNGIYVSYLDTNYIGNDMPILFHHEFVHYYDNALGGIYRPSILEEGLAVYLSGGHFKPEPIGPRAASLLDLGWYIPLTSLVDNFYNQQHDIAYLEAGSLIQYMIDTFGWNAFNEFYRTIPAPNNQPVSSVLSAALYKHFGRSFTEWEDGYLSYLHSFPISETERTDLQLTVNFFDTVRRYQKVLDPSAYFQTAWLPDGAVMRQRGIVADFLRRPMGWKNQLLEALLIRSQKVLYSGDYQLGDTILKGTNWMLDIVAR